MRWPLGWILWFVVCFQQQLLPHEQPPFRNLAQTLPSISANLHSSPKEHEPYWYTQGCLESATDWLFFSVFIEGPVCGSVVRVGGVCA